MVLRARTTGPGAALFFTSGLAEARTPTCDLDQCTTNTAPTPIWTRVRNQRPFGTRGSQLRQSQPVQHVSECVRVHVAMHGSVGRVWQLVRVHVRVYIRVHIRVRVRVHGPSPPGSLARTHARVPPGWVHAACRRGRGVPEQRSAPTRLLLNASVAPVFQTRTLHGHG
jgi:hypothetical protein